MRAASQVDTSDIEPQEHGIQDGTPPSKRKALSNVRRALTEDELGTPGVQQLLLDELDRLETEVDELTPFKEKYHSADKDAAVLEERLRASGTRDVCLAVGAGIIGLTPSLWPSQPTGWIVLALGVVLVVAVAARRVWS